MSTIRNATAHTEFWRPPVEDRNLELDARTVVCGHCQSEFVMGARDCHVCGMDRNPQPKSSRVDWDAMRNYLRLPVISNALGVNVASLVAFFVAVVCGIAALVVGAFYQVETVADWQAIQIWRLEWLLAAIACLLVGILLKTRSSEQ